MSKKRTPTGIKNYTVVQANDLIRNKKDFSLWELRVFALLASHVKKEDDDFHTYKFRIKDLLDLFETKSNNLYEELREIPEKLHSRLVRIPYVDQKGKKRLRRYNLISMSDVPDEAKVDEGEYIELRFDKDLKPLLLQLGEHFTVYKFYNILKLRSPYIFQLYELLKSEEYKGNRDIDIELDEFRGILRIPDSYKFGNINQRILRPAQIQFKEHTDITFEYTPVKGRGGKCIKLRFRIYKNAKNSAPEISETPTSKTAKEPSVFAELYPEIKNWVTEEAFKKILSEYPEPQVRNAINVTLNRLNKGDDILNVTGHIIALAKQTNLFDSVQAKKEKAVAKKETKSLEKSRRLELEAKQRQLYKELRTNEDAIIEAIFIEKPELKDELFQELKTNRFSGYRKGFSFEENMEDSMFVAAYRNLIKKKFKTRFAALDKRYQPKIKSVRAALAML